VATANRKAARANALATYHLNLATITTVCQVAFALERCRPDPIGLWFRVVQHDTGMLFRREGWQGLGITAKPRLDIHHGYKAV
jgi:hypothetical protein